MNCCKVETEVVRILDGRLQTGAHTTVSFFYVQAILEPTKSVNVRYEIVVVEQHRMTPPCSRKASSHDNR